MSSPVSGAVLPDAVRRNPVGTFLVWNRRLHYYLGLYLLFFCWLFALTGLLLNHQKWEFAQFWPNRVQTRIERDFAAPQGTTDLARAQELMRQLGIVGEVHWPNVQPAGGPFSFQVSRPGRVVEVKADLATKRATLHQSDLNTWGIVQVLHTFSGVRTTDPLNKRDWFLTTVWTLSMDAVAVGLIAMVLSSYIMWYRLKAKRRWGIVALLSGCATCGVFLVGLRWLM